MSSKFIFHGYHPIISRLHIFDHTFGPTIAGYPSHSAGKWALFFAAQDVFWTMARNSYKIENVIGAIANEKKLSKEDWEIVLLAAKVDIPEWMKKRINIAAKMYERAWRKIRPAYDEVIAKWDKMLLKRPIKIYTSFEPTMGSYGGTAYPGDVFVLGVPVTGDIDTDRAMHTLVHESIHIMHKRDKTMSKILDKIHKKTKLPVHEAFTETLTNVVMWRANIQKEMFDKYYDKEWSALCKIEDQMREIVKRWWEEGGDLKKMVKGAFKV